MLTSVNNPRVKDVVRLRNRRHRERERRFVIEGERELAYAIDAGFPVSALYHCAEFHADRGEADLVRRFAATGTTCDETSADVFRKMSYRRTPDGLLGVAEAPTLTLDALPDASEGTDEALWLVAVGIEKPGNLGAMLRSLDAAGGTGLLIADAVADVFNPNAVRASVGAVFGLPIATASGDAIRAWLERRGIPLLAASPQAETIYTAATLTGPVALAVGSEHRGLGEDWLASAQTVSIPMAGRVDSVNAATAAALLLFEARRQRGGRSRESASKGSP